jgi:ATP adenylyltransferase
MGKTGQGALLFLVFGIIHVTYTMEPPPPPPAATSYYYAPWREDYRDRQKLAAGCCFLCNELASKNAHSWIFQLDGNYFYLIVNANPYTQSGTLLIVPSAHIADLQGLSSTVKANLADVLRKIAHILLRLFRYSGFSMGINTGRVSGASVPDHLHIHIIPETPTNTYPDVAHMLAADAQDLQPASESLYQAFRAALAQPIQFINPPSSDGSQHNCYFCNLIAEGTNSIDTNLIIVRSEHCFIMFNNHPRVRGHMIIVPYEHQASPDACTDQTITAMIETCAQLAGICTEILRNQGSNTGLNVGHRQIDGRPSGHVSMDFLPRWDGDRSSFDLANTQILSIDMKRLRQRIIERWNAKKAPSKM